MEKLEVSKSAKLEKKRNENCSERSPAQSQLLKMILILIAEIQHFICLPKKISSDVLRLVWKNYDLFGRENPIDVKLMRTQWRNRATNEGTCFR